MVIDDYFLLRWDSLILCIKNFQALQAQVNQLMNSMPTQVRVRVLHVCVWCVHIMFMSVCVCVCVCCLLLACT